MSPYDEWIAIEHARLELSILADNLKQPHFKGLVQRDFAELTKDSKRIRKMFTKGSRR